MFPPEDGTLSPRETPPPKAAIIINGIIITHGVIIRMALEFRPPPPKAATSRGRGNARGCNDAPPTVATLRSLEGGRGGRNLSAVIIMLHTV